MTMITSTGSNFIHIRLRGDTFDVAGAPAFNWGMPISGSGRPNGVWAQWEWNGRELMIRHDAGGFQPVYYFTRPGEIAVAPSLATLLERGAPRELDDDALAVFFRLGFFVGDDTPFQAIRAVPANADLRWTARGVELIETASPTVATSTLDRREAIAEYQRLFSQAIRRRLPEGPVAMPLSGGRDSRHILFELVSQGHRPDLALTIGRATDNEVAVAATLTREFGVHHELVPVHPFSVKSERVKNVGTDFCADEGTWLWSIRGPLEDREFTVYDGIGGGVLSAGTFLAPVPLALFRTGMTEELARLLIQSNRRSFNTLFLTDDTARRFSEERCVARLTAELEKHVDAANPCGSFYFKNRTRREIALGPFAILGDFKVHAPYLDVDLVDFLMSLPGEMLLDHRFHDDTIAQAYPQWGHFPYSTRKPAFVRFKDMPKAWSALGWTMTRSSATLNYAHLLPRLLRAGVDPVYNKRAYLRLLIYPVYWLQLEEAMEKR